MVNLATIVLQLRVNEGVDSFCTEDPITSEVPDEIVISIGSRRDESGMNNIGNVLGKKAMYDIEVPTPIGIYGVDFQG